MHLFYYLTASQLTEFLKLIFTGKLKEIISFFGNALEKCS